MWLIRKRGLKARAHIWNGSDTACRMWSTGGLKRDLFECSPDRGQHEICHMCAVVARANGAVLPVENGLLFGALA